MSLVLLLYLFTDEETEVQGIKLLAVITQERTGPKFKLRLAAALSVTCHGESPFDPCHHSPSETVEYREESVDKKLGS